ncbi:MAG: hypothetical protein HYV60_23530 [Planctomycetia bacterium]|nr:hypothetical protein [Planctomycetia bacterium]
MAGYLLATGSVCVGAWQYIPGDDAEFAVPVARSFAMSAERPEDLSTQVDWRGERQWYAQVRYGNEASKRVSVVVDESGAGKIDLYVDRNRNRVIQPVDLIDGEGRERDFDLATEIVQEEFVEHYPRRVRFRLGITGRQFSLGTTGFVAGTARLGEQANQVRLVDGDVNGLFGDDRDRIWIDLNRDSKWDAFSEQFPFRPMLVLGDTRWAVRADRVGARFRLEPVTGVGQLRMRISDLPAGAKVIGFAGMVYAEDGSAYAVNVLNEPLSVPVGRYTPQSVTVVIDAGERQPWYFSFSRSRSPGPQDWFTIEADGTTDIEAVGSLSLLAGVEGPTLVKPGSAVHLRPRMYTSHGLLINMSCRGRDSAATQNERFHNQATMTLYSAENAEGVANAKSGFA